MDGRATALPPARRSPRSGIEVSFEFFPPKTAEMEATLWASIDRLSPLCPSFVSVTYGAGGATRERTHATVARIAKETAIKPAAHLTCVAATCDEVNDVAHAYWDAGVKHVVALRGDPQGGLGNAFAPHPEGYATSTDLISGLKKIADFEITVSAYPEGHAESGCVDDDIDVLQAKIDAGATRAITQFFFENDLYLRFLDKVRARGITIPILPGIMPVQNFRQQANFARKAGTFVPQWLADRFEGLDDDPTTRRLIATTVAAEQVFDLVDEGVKDFHFYTMNRADLAFAICHLLGVRPKVAEKAEA